MCFFTLNEWVINPCLIYKEIFVLLDLFIACFDHSSFRSHQTRILSAAVWEWRGIGTDCPEIALELCINLDGSIHLVSNSLAVITYKRLFSYSFTLLKKYV